MQPADTQARRNRLIGIKLQERVDLTGLRLAQATPQRLVFQVTVQRVIHQPALEIIEGHAVTGLERRFGLDEQLALILVIICQADAGQLQGE